MTLNTIAATALKGQSFAHALGAATLFTGRNDAGKTARTDAVRLVLLGYLPELGKTNAATFALSSASKMAVEADILGHGQVRREWKASGKSVKATEAGTDGLPETPLVLLNANEYLGKSDAARVQMLWQTLNVDPAEWTITSVREKLQAATGEQWQKLPEGVIADPEPNETLQAWMERIGEALKAAASAASAEVRRWEQTAQGITAAGLQEVPVDAARVANDIATCRGALEKLGKEHARLSEVARQQARGADRAGVVKARIEDLRARIGEAPLSTIAPATLEQEILDLVRQRAGLMAEWQQLEQRANEARKRAEAAESIRTRIAEATRQAEALDAAQSTLARLEHELEAAGVEISAAVESALSSATTAKADAVARQRVNDDAQAKLETQARDMVTKPCCPVCGTRGETFHKQVEELFELRRKELQAEARAIAADFLASEEALRKAQTAQNEAIATQRRRQALERQIGEARLAVQRADQAAASVKDWQAQLAAETEVPAIELPSTAELETLASSIADKRAELTRIDLNEKLAAAEEELRAISIDGDDNAEQQAAELEDRIEAHQNRLAELEAAAVQAANQGADKKRLAQAADEKAAAEAEGAAIALVRDSLSEQRAALIKATFEPLLRVANMFTRGILETPLEYRDGEIGRYKKGSWVPVRCMGGTHQAVTYAGIQAALGANAPAKVVVVDELGRFDRENKHTFMANVMAAIREGVIEQFVGIDVDGSAYEGIEGLTLEAVK